MHYVQEKKPQRVFRQKLQLIEKVGRIDGSKFCCASHWNPIIGPLACNVRSVNAIFSFTSSKQTRFFHSLRLRRSLIPFCSRVDFVDMLNTISRPFARQKGRPKRKEKKEEAQWICSQVVRCCTCLEIFCVCERQLDLVSWLCRSIDGFWSMPLNN